MADRAAAVGAALSGRPLIGDAWRRCWLDASLPYYATSPVADELRATEAAEMAHCLVALVDGPLATPESVTELRTAGWRLLLLAPAGMSSWTRVALQAGVDGLITLDDPIAEMRHALAHLTRGLAFASPAGARLLLEDQRSGLNPSGAQGVTLSRREREVLRAMVDGLTTKAIARRMGIAVKTVEAHRSRLFARLHVHTQSEAVTRAIGDRRLLADQDGPSER